MAKRRPRRNMRDSFQSILEIDLSSCLTNLCLATVAGNGASPAYHRLRITDTVAAEFNKIVQALLMSQKRRFDGGTVSLRSYDAIAKLDSHEIEHVDLRQHEAVRSQLAGLLDISGLPTFAESDDLVAALRFYVVVVQPDSDVPLLFFRLCSPKMELRQSPKLALFFSKDQYDKFDESLLVFDRGIDCVCCGDDMFIFNKGRFESIFQFFEMVKEAASETLETIKTTIPIHNFSELEEACLNHLQMLKKLKNIAAQPYLNRITMSDIKKAIEEMDLPLKVERHNGKEKLVFDSSDKWAILRLLDDDYLQSIMTGEKYEVNSKRTR
jgi:hypothetical protein